MENTGIRWVDRFIIAAIIQGGIITVMALAVVGFQIIFTDVNIMQHLSLSFGFKHRYYWGNELFSGVLFGPKNLSLCII